ncbi:hypothetical protein [Arthrobacter sp. A2-55]|uniref:hypothetical protein n=1 Tax=Arthrobacter sp. A2-55 TaxID=2897337 RepID=UPI0021CD636C|nr:hypothetical protein [Arthrobacter sp. A2-55]MCU6480506.1 hypothetical protein [Arthrobacter sp. A2-55]
METTTLPLHRIANALDGCFNLTEERILSSETRAMVFKAIDQPSVENWLNARSIIVSRSMTLWQAVIAAGAHPKDIPTGLQIIEAIEWTQP